MASLKADIDALGYDWSVQFHGGCEPGEKFRCDITKRESESSPFLVGQGYGNTEIEAIENALKDLEDD